MQRRAAVSATLGSALEWFDFSIYGALSATLFPVLFFSALGETGAVLASLASFGVGFVARPLGGVVFGYLGDRVGRRPILLVTLVVMGLSSVFIGLLPTGQGVAVAVILVALRFLQGFALGGEATGGQLMTMEHADPTRRGIMGALVNVGSPLSQVFSNLTLVVLTGLLTKEDWASWGWRIPFLLAILLVATGIYIRLRLEETPAFVVQKNNARRPINGLRVLITSPGRVVQLTLVWAGPALAFYLIAVYGLSYLTRTVGISTNESFLILVIANAVSVVAGLAGGLLCDRIGRKPVLLIAVVACVAAVLMFFPVADTANFGLILFVVTLSCSAVQFGYGAQPAFFAEQFPTSTRFSGSALSLTLANLLFAAPAPFVAAALTNSLGSAAVVWSTIGVLVISLVALAKARDRRAVDLAAWTDDR